MVDVAGVNDVAGVSDVPVNVDETEVADVSVGRERSDNFGLFDVPDAKVVEGIPPLEPKKKIEGIALSFSINAACAINC